MALSLNNKQDVSALKEVDIETKSKILEKI